MSKYLKVQVARSLVTDLYIRVPDDFPVNRLHHLINAPALIPAARELSSFDWETDFTMSDLEVDIVNEVSEEEANQYHVSDLAGLPPERSI